MKEIKRQQEAVEVGQCESLTPDLGGRFLLSCPGKEAFILSSGLSKL